uniref:Uncharacterized protein n=1 Tax=Knipowitschia caucasica TaxID=637954 RepID=A0AAV2KAS9_KNICA
MPYPSGVYEPALVLPLSKPEDHIFSICKSLLQIPQQYWVKIKDGFIDSTTLAYISEFIMDLIQHVSQSILTIILPQLYKRMTSRGLTPCCVMLTEDQVANYMGDSVRRALAMSFHEQTVGFTENFKNFLISNITSTVNDVLVLGIQTTVRQDVLPVFFVAGSACSVFDLSQFAQEGFEILKSGSGLIPHCLYLKTEEMINRAVKQVLQWVWWCDGNPPNCDPLNQIPESPEFDMVLGGGDQHLSSDEEEDEVRGDEEEVEQQQPQQPPTPPPPTRRQPMGSILLNHLTKSSFLALIVGEVLTLIGIRDWGKIQLMLRNLITGVNIPDLIQEPFDAVVGGRSFRDICQGAIRDLLDVYGSVFALHQAVNEHEPSFELNLMEVIQNRLSLPPINIEASEIQSPAVNESAVCKPQSRQENTEPECQDQPRPELIQPECQDQPRPEFRQPLGPACTSIGTHSLSTRSRRGLCPGQLVEEICVEPKESVLPHLIILSMTVYVWTQPTYRL